MTRENEPRNTWTEFAARHSSVTCSAPLSPRPCHSARTDRLYDGDSVQGRIGPLDQAKQRFSLIGG